MTAPTPLPAGLEGRLARNNGDATLELASGPLEPNELAIVNPDDPAVVDAGTILELDPATSKLNRLAPPAVGLELNSAGVDVSAGVRL